MDNLKLVATLRPNESYHTTNSETGVKRPRFRYTLTGSPQALAEYKRIKEAEGYYREDADGKVLFTSGHKKSTMSIELVDGIVIPKTADDTVMALESVYYAETDAIVKARLADKIADAKIAIAMRGTQAPVASTESAEVEEPASEDEANL
jgi:hypothetical protein